MGVAHGASFPGKRRQSGNPEMRGADKLRKPIRCEEDGGPANGESPRAGPRADGKGLRSRRPVETASAEKATAEQGRVVARGEEGVNREGGSGAASPG